MTKTKWNTDQILAEARRVQGEHKHDRKKYRRSMLHDGTMRVPAALVVEMLGKGDGYSDEHLLRKIAEQAKENGRLQRNEKICTQEIATLKAKLETTNQQWRRTEIRDITPEERAVLDAARGVGGCRYEENRDSHTITITGAAQSIQPFISAMHSLFEVESRQLSLHKAEEKTEQQSASTCALSSKCGARGEHCIVCPKFETIF